MNVAALLARHGLDDVDPDSVVRIAGVPDDPNDLAALIPEGEVGLLEFSAYPGFRFEEILREILVVHCAGISDSTEFVQQAAAIFEFMAANGQTESFRHFMAAELERLAALSGPALLYELDTDRRGYHRHEIEEMAHKAGLHCECGPLDFASESYALLHRRTQERQSPPAADPLSQREDNALYHEHSYPNYLHPRLHPDQLATMSRLFGLNPPDPSRCRFLELGCGTGHSLLAFANDLKESEFFGIDFSEAMIAEGRQAAADLGLENITFLATNVMNLEDETVGPFDYIVMHGMLSWVPQAVGRRMLEICRNRLTPNGIVYVSCNAYPGYLLPLMLRDAVAGPGRHVATGPKEAELAVRRIQAMPLDALPEHRRHLMQPCLENLLESNPLQMMFDEFADVNHAWRFGEVCEMAGHFGLRYVTEAGIENWTARTLSPAAQQLLHDLSEEPVRRMQYRDCLRLTRFHASLFCREDQKPASEPLLAEARRLLVSTRAYPVSSELAVTDGSKETFESPGGAAVALSDPLLKALLVVLHRSRPARLTLEQLLKEACSLARVPADPGAVMQKVAPLLLPFYETGMIDLHWHMPELSRQATARPLASSYARLCAESGSLVLPSLLGVAALLDTEQERLLLLALDGSRNRDSLEHEFQLTAPDLEAKLRNFARLGLLAA